MRKLLVKLMNRSLIFVTALVLLGLFFPTWTPKIQRENSISWLGQVKMNGTKHEIMIRGANASNPIIIFVHGGPGSSEIPYVRKYQEELEQHFTIVHYDQRGSGKSPREMLIRQLKRHKVNSSSQNVKPTTINFMNQSKRLSN